MNILTIEKKKFFKEEDIKEIEFELIGDKNEHEREMEIYYHDFLKRTYSPEFLVSNYFSEELDNIKFAKNGIINAMFNLKKNLNEEELKNFLENLNLSFKNKKYSCLKNNDGENIILENIIFEYFKYYDSKKKIDEIISENTKKVF